MSVMITSPACQIHARIGMGYIVLVKFKYRGCLTKLIVRSTEGGKYQWEALGNTGEAKSLNEAISQAREYVMSGYDPLNDRNKRGELD